MGSTIELNDTIDAEHDQTCGRFCITQLYPRDYAALVNQHDAPPGRGLS